MRNVWIKVIKKIKTYFIVNSFFLFENLAFYEVMWKNIVERGRPHMTIWRMHTAACWIPKATNTASEYVIFIAFPLQQWLHERNLKLTLYVHCLSCYDYGHLYSFISIH